MPLSKLPKSYKNDIFIDDTYVLSSRDTSISALFVVDAKYIVAKGSLHAMEENN